MSVPSNQVPSLSSNHPVCPSPPRRALEDLSRLEPSDEVAGRVKDVRRRMKRAVAPMDYYAVLGVAGSSSMAEIKAAYRKLAMRYHPDRPGCNQGVIFQYISQASLPGVRASSLICRLEGGGVLVRQTQSKE